MNLETRIKEVKNSLDLFTKDSAFVGDNTLIIPYGIEFEESNAIGKTIGEISESTLTRKNERIRISSDEFEEVVLDGCILPFEKSITYDFNNQVIFFRNCLFYGEPYIEINLEDMELPFFEIQDSHFYGNTKIVGDSINIGKGCKFYGDLDLRQKSQRKRFGGSLDLLDLDVAGKLSLNYNS